VSVWSTFVDLLSSLITQLAQWLDGSYGLAIVVLALMVRMALLPLMLKTAEQGWRQQQQLAAMKPEIDRLRERHHKDPAAQAMALQALYREHGFSPKFGNTLLTAAVQAPLGAGIYAAIRQGMVGAGSFLWIPKLARPDFLLALAVAVLSYAAVLLNPAMTAQTKTLLQMLPVLVSFFMVWHLAAGLGLYWAGSSSVSLLQMLLLRRRIRRAA
jgi:YidC/Oxa1 family membrane protein insertase